MINLMLKSLIESRVFVSYQLTVSEVFNSIHIFNLCVIVLILPVPTTVILHLDGFKTLQ